MAWAGTGNDPQVPRSILQTSAPTGTVERDIGPAQVDSRGGVCVTRGGGGGGGNRAETKLGHTGNRCNVILYYKEANCRMLHRQQNTNGTRQYDSYSMLHNSNLNTT